MIKRLLFSCALVSVLAVLVPGAALAHGLAGKRFFPATLATDDPFVADELSLPTISHIKKPGAGDTAPTKETDLSAEFSKRLSLNLGLSLGGTFNLLDPDPGKSVTGFDNLEVSLKYVFFKSDEHEMLLSVGVGWDVGGTGSKRRVDAERFDTVTPSLFFGKGFGDLPDQLELLKPLALTGALGWAVPSRVRTQTITTDPDTGDVDVDRELNPTVFKWGFSGQYSLQYLQSYVRDVGIPAPFDRMIPIVEVALQTPIDGPHARDTTGTVNPGVIWFGRYFQLGIEAVIPFNTASGKNVGVLAQIHFYLDDILPQIFTWTPFHGVLGPTQLR
jgi:hypothetical protein